MEDKATEQLDVADEMLNAGWSKMDDLEWKRWAFIIAVRLVSSLVYAILAIREEIAYWGSAADRRARTP